MSFELLDFQQEASDQLREAAVEWVEAIRANQRPPLTVDGESIPLLAQIQAITGAGKTPLLASVIGDIGPAIVFWTTKSKIVVQQTAEKLRTTYAPLLPPDKKILDDIPTPDEWEELFAQEAGLTIWIRTVASWNEPADARRSDEDARLNLHRKAMKREGEQSPWEQLADAEARNRPLWVVYDEGHGQTAVQLDQLLDLSPMGIIAATATPVPSKRWQELTSFLKAGKTWGPIHEKAQITVPTGAVARAGLLKNEVRVHDLNVEDSARLDQVYKRYTELDKVAKRQGGAIQPRALYIVERSNLKKGETGEPPPTVIWRHLHERLGVPADQIGVATDTKDLPKEAEVVSDFSALTPKHRHVIFNKKLEEGWDNPEAYVAYFDGETTSARRIKQLIGRVVRQPNGKHQAEQKLNTAYLYVASPNERFSGIVAALQKQLLDEYGADEYGQATIKVYGPGDEPEEISLRAGIPEFELPVWKLSASGKLTDLLDAIAKEGTRDFKPEELSAPGQIVSRSFKLADEQRAIVKAATTAGDNIKTPNGVYFRDRVAALSRAARIALKDSALDGSMYQQSSSHGSYAQKRLAEDADKFVEEFVNRVSYVEDWAARRNWKPRSWTPRSGERKDFKRSLHIHYTDAPSVLNTDEAEFADALDEVMDGWWARNFTTAAQNSYGIELPIKVQSSNTFYPDFLWWVNGVCWAIDTTGPHLLTDKVRGKLMSIQNPTIAFVTRGRMSKDLLSKESPVGWTLVRASNAGPRVEHYATLAELLAAVRS